MVISDQFQYTSIFIWADKHTQYSHNNTNSLLAHPQRFVFAEISLNKNNIKIKNKKETPQKWKNDSLRRNYSFSKELYSTRVCPANFSIFSFNYKIVLC